MAADKFGFVVVRKNFWVAENVGDTITGVVVGFEPIETEFGTGTQAIVVDVDTREEHYVLVSGGLSQLPKQEHKLVRITYEGEKENPKAKSKRQQVFKSYKLEVATKFDYAQWVLAD